MKTPALIIGLALGIFLVSPALAADTDVLKSDLARHSYAFGMNIGYRVRSGLSVTRSRPGETLTMCPLHQSVGKADGSVERRR